MLISSPQQIRKADALTLKLDGSAMELQTKLKKLGVILDANLTFVPHVQNTVKTEFFNLRNIARLRPKCNFFLLIATFFPPNFHFILLLTACLYI